MTTANTIQAGSRIAGVLEEPVQASGSSSEVTGGGFPTDTLPPRMKKFVEECAKSLPVPPDLIALPVLVTAGAAIGNSRIITLKEGWKEPACIYGAIVAPIGAMKSQALRAATAPLREQDRDDRRTWASDITIEQLGILLNANERGLLVVRDELSAWVKSLNQYRGGRGADRQFYLSAWSGEPISVDRKGDCQGGVRVSVPRPFLAVIGCIPPDVLSELQEHEGQQDGFIERILFAWPEPVPTRWTDAAVSTPTQAGYETLIQALLGLDGRVPLHLTSEAERRFKEWVDAHCAEMESPELPPVLKGFSAKLKGYCGRLALIHALACDPAAKEIGELSVLAAAAQVEYFKLQAEKVADRLCRSVGVGNPLKRCKEAIRRKLLGGKRLKKREIQRAINYDAKVFNQAFETQCKPELVSHSDGTYSLNTLPNTETPTTDTTDNGSGGKE